VSGESFDTACNLVEQALTGPFRREMAAAAATKADARTALRRLRESLGTHTLKAHGRTLDLDGSVRALDAEVRDDGFHVLHDWDGKAGRVNADTIPVNVLDYIAGERGSGPPD
jgi:flagellar basal body rod protein FlgF